MIHRILKRYAVSIIFISVFLFNTNPVLADELSQQTQGVWRAEVLEVVSEEKRHNEELNIDEDFQQLKVEILQGPEKGKVITIDNDFLPLKKGDKFFLNHTVNMNGEEMYIIQEPDRRFALFFFMGLFVLVVVYFGGMQGFRSLLSLGGSFLIIFYFLFPRLLGGSSPFLISSIFAILVLIFSIYITHGISRKSSAALVGTMITVVLAIVLANLAVKMTQLSGLVEEASVFLNLHTGGKLDFRGLLLGAIIIGVLGILDDIGITQASTVKELHHAAPDLSRKEIYKKVLGIGREHVSALVNTLALAYASAALPLLLLFYNSESLFLTINREIFAAEIIRTIVGSIAIILCVPITTAIAVRMLTKKS